MKKLIIISTCLLFISCDSKSTTTGSYSRSKKNLLVGDISEFLLPEMQYKRITDRRGASLEGGSRPLHSIFEIDALRYKPKAVHWVGIKSLYPIPGKGDSMFFRYRIMAELYPTEAAAKLRDDEFDSVYKQHVEDAEDWASVAKVVIPVAHFHHDRIFYLLTTDMSASSDSNEVGRLKFAIVQHLSE